MPRATRSVLGLVVVAIAIVAVPPGPARPDVASAQRRTQDERTSRSTGMAPPTSPIIEIADTGHGYPGADVAYNSQFDEYLVVWEEPKKIWGRRVSSRGQPIGSSILIESGAPYGYEGPQVAYDSQRNRYLVIWGRGGGSADLFLHGRFVPALGPDAGLTAFPIDPGPIPLDAVYTLGYGLAQDEFLAVWNRKTGGAFREATYGRRIEADGSGFPASTFLLTEHTTDNRWRPDAAYNLVRNEYLVAVDDGNKVNDNIYGTRLTAGGSILGSGEFGIAGWPDEEYGASVAACPDGDQYLVVWHSIRTLDNSDGIYACFVSGDGSPGDVVQVKSRTSWEWRSADVACGVTNTLRQAPRYLVAWAEDTAQPANCRARQVYLLGTMDAETVYIGGECRDVVLAGGAMNYLAVFVSGSKVRARIVGNTRPAAHFAVAPQEGDSTTVFQFDSSGTTDVTNPTGLQVRWDWDGNGVYETAWDYPGLTSHSFSLADWQSMVVFTVRLQAGDVLGATDEATGQVTVYNAPPTAVLAVEPSSGSTATTFLFDASNSSDPESGTLEYRWDLQADGTYDTDWSTAAQRTVNYPTPGTYSVRVQVRDNWEQADSQSRTVLVAQPGALEQIHLPLIMR